MQSNSLLQSQAQLQIPLKTTLVINPTVNPLANPAVNPTVNPTLNPSSRPAIVSLPPETFQCIPHVQPQRFILGWIWTLFVGSLISVLGAMVFTSLTRTGSVPEWSMPNLSGQEEANRG